jgi:hypothetical protein
MRPAYIFESKYRVTVLIREDTKGTGTPLYDQGARQVYRWVTCWRGTRAGVYGQSIRRFSFSLGKYATAFQAEASPSWPLHMILKLMEYHRNT